MWDDDPEGGPLDDTSGPSIRRKADPPIDLPLGPASEALPTARAGDTAIRHEPPDSAPPPARRKAKVVPPLFPDWNPAPADTVPEPLPSQRRTGRAVPHAEPDPEPPSPCAPVGARALAGLADIVLLGLAGGILLLVVRLLGGAPLATRPAVWTLVFTLELAVVASSLSLFLFGKTPGMALASLHAEEPEGEPIRFKRAVVRTLAGLCGVVLPGVGLLVAAVRDDGRSLVDLMSGSVVRPSPEEEEDGISPGKDFS